MADPLTTSIATAVATGATTALADGVRTMVTKLAAVIRDRFRREQSDQDTLDAAMRDPSDTAAVGRLAELLEGRMRDDPDFAERVRALWSEIAAASHDKISNVVTGPVHGSVIQARDVHGGIAINQPPQPRPAADG